MQVLKEVTDADLDDRMLPETKQFVTRFLQTTDPRAITRLPLSVVRETRVNNSKLMNQALSVKDLELRELTVKSEVDGYEIPVTGYIPKGVTSGAPLVVFFHGGGWTFCTRVTHHFAAATISDASKTVWLSVEYRLGPEFKHPVGLEDCISVTKWALKNKSLFNLNEDVHVGVCGDSAGGNYSATISHILRNELSFQLLVYPCVHLTMKSKSSAEFVRDCHVLIPESIDFFVKNLINNDQEAETDPRLSPLLYEDFKSLPKALIVAAELDPLVDQSKIYHEKLLENNNTSELYIVKGVTHGYFNSPPFFPTAFKETTQHFVDFLNKFKK